MPPRTQRIARRLAAASLPANQFPPHGPSGRHTPSIGRGLIPRGRRPNVGRAYFSVAGSLVHTGIERFDCPARKSPKTGGLARAAVSGRVGVGPHHGSTSATPQTSSTIQPRDIRGAFLRPTSQPIDRPHLASRRAKTSPECPATTGARLLLTEEETRPLRRAAFVLTIAAHPVGSSSLGFPSTNAARYLSAHPSGRDSAPTQWVARRVGFFFGGGSGMAPSPIAPAGREARRGALHTAAASRTSRVIGPGAHRLRTAHDSPSSPSGAGAAALFHNEAVR